MVRLFVYAAVAGAVASAVVLGACDRSLRVTSPADPAAEGRDSLRVCADPNNLPFSTASGLGFEVELGQLVAAELQRPLAVHWRAQRRGQVREALNVGRCDVLPGIVASSELVLTTRPYYRSTYVFLTRRDAARRLTALEHLDDPTLRSAIIGVHVIDDDSTNTPPTHALANRGIVRNVRGYSLFGDDRNPNPPLALVQAVRERAIDVAIVWGPFAGWAAHADSTLQWRPVTPQIDLPFLPFVYDIAMGVRRSDPALRDALDAALGRRQADVERLLARYGVPRL